MNKKTIGLSLVVLLLLIGGTVWALRSRDNAQLDKVREMGKELFTGDGPPNREKREQFRNEMEKLSESQREAFGEQMRQEGERRMDQEIAKVLAMPQQQQNAYLDKQILEGEKRAKEWAARAQTAMGQTPQRQGPPGAGPNAGPRGGRQTRTPEQQLAQRKKRLDYSTPEQRAQRTAYREAIQKRRMALGLPPTPPRGPRPR